MNNMDKLRTLYLWKILYEETDEDHALSTNELIEILDKKYAIKAHRQTIKTEIERLRGFGVEIEEVKSTQNRYNLCGRRFDTPELKLLIDAVESSKFITAKKSKELVEKISSLTSIYIATSLNRKVSCEGRIKPGNERIYLIIDVICDAINANKQITFQYFTYNAHKEKVLKHDGKEYHISPLQLVWNGDYYYVIGINEEKGYLANFRVDRIATRPRIDQKEVSSTPEDFDIDEYINTTFRMFNSKHEEVELLCDNHVMDSIIDRFGEDIQVENVDEEHFCTCVKIAVNHVFFSWVFGFGGKVKIKGPNSVKEEYLKMLQAGLQQLEE